MGNYINVVQTFTGLGMASGPIIGSFFYQIGGFRLPFFAQAVMLASLILPIHCFLIKDGKAAENERDDNTREDDDGEKVSLIENNAREDIALIEDKAVEGDSQKVSFFNILKNGKIFACSLCMMTSLLVVTYWEPIL